MAVVPMQKVRLVVHETDAEAVLRIVQRAGALEFQPTAIDQLTAEPEITFPNAQLLPRVQHSVQFLEPYAPEVGLWQRLRQGVSTELTEHEVASTIEDTDVVQLVVDDLEQLQVEIAEAEEAERQLQKQHEILEAWRALPISIRDLQTKRTSTYLVSRPAVGDREPLPETLTTTLETAGIPFALTVIDEDRVALTLPNEQVVHDQIEELTAAQSAVITETPVGSETPEVELVAAAERLAAAKGKLALLYDQAEHFAITHLKTLRVAAEALTWQRDRHTVAEAGRATTHTIVLDGWLHAGKRPALEQAFAERQLAVVLSDIEPAEGEEPPVEIENKPLVQPFEAVTRLYGMPGYKDLDPTVFLAGFFFLFFGMSLTDVGYGLVLMVISVMILTLFKVAPPIRLFAKLLLFVGFATVLVGLLFGGYLGIDPKYLPDFLKALQLYDPIGNPLPVFYTALGLGVVQVMAGMIIKIYSDYRNGQLVAGVLDQGPWLFVFTMGILYLGTATGYITLLTEAQIINLLYVGAAMIVLSKARHGEGVFARIKNALVGLYESIGYFSDILSYSRLLALGLATTALAFAVNLIAGMVSDVPYIGAILALAILLIGHVFTLAVNTLGAFIHSARLQFVEFFGKFITGTGRSFAPLTRTKKYIAVKDD